MFFKEAKDFVTGHLDNLGLAIKDGGILGFPDSPTDKNRKFLKLIEQF